MVANPNPFRAGGTACLCAIVGKGMEPALKFQSIQQLGYFEILEMVQVRFGGDYGVIDDAYEEKQEEAEFTKVIARSLSRLGKWSLSVATDTKKFQLDEQGKQNNLAFQ